MGGAQAGAAADRAVRGRSWLPLSKEPTGDLIPRPTDHDLGQRQTLYGVSHPGIPIFREKKKRKKKRTGGCWVAQSVGCF